MLLKMCEEQRRRGGNGGDRRLASFRTALDGMGLFSESYGPAPICAGNEGSVEADKIMTAARR